ncbi:TonB-dependent receptor [Sphingomonas oligophenolica]|uniref:TonB-dependent receptor n=1 Tax=Sphingomonas oligophenolica TaxID=301154 RepID=A0ABU9Y275_9SPHN
MTGIQGSSRRTWLLASVGAALAVGIALPAQAQQLAANADAPAAAQQVSDPAASVDQADAAKAAQTDDIVVTGSRIVSSGFKAPTPTQMLSAADLTRNAEPNVFTTIAQLPSLQGSTGTSVNVNSTSSGLQGLSSFSLRGLGPIRTLTLLDGQRVVGANVTGVPDISLFPQLLIKRVDVVTGGASASYGSDAVGGVVNFVTDKRFEGFKANVAGGITTYGDDKQYLIQAAAGHNFGRFHVEVSGEYDHEDGIPSPRFGEAGANGRDWYRTTTFINRGVTNDGSPQYLVRDHAQAYQYTKYGLITAGPLQGTAFDVNGNPFTFQYGGGTPAKNAAGTVNGCYSAGAFCLGGDLSGNVGNGTTPQSALKRWDGYSRIGYDIDDNNEIYASVNIARVDTSNTPNPGANKTGLTIQCSNPFVPASIQAQCVTAGITSFQFGTSNGELPRDITVYPTRSQYRFVLGAAGKVSALGSDWRYDLYGEHGENITDIHVENITLNSRYAAAVQAITVGGQIVCADPVARANGCVPLNIFGGATPSAATLAYISPANGPFQHTRQTQDVVSVAFSGEPVTLPAGPLAVAFGGEYRNEFYHVTADPYGNGVTAETPNSAAYPADPVLNSGGANWYAGNYHAGRGSYNVYEGFLELNVPLFKSTEAGRANLNVAGRATHYSTSGTVYTWKIGGTWDTPFDGIRFRAVTSRDVRAPNLSELFAAPTTTTLPSFTNPDPNRPAGSPATLLVFQNTIGNTALKPEVAHNTEVGVVLSGASWLPGFSASVDYYHIKVDGVISTLGAQQEVNLCYAGVTTLCGAFNLYTPAGTTPYVNVQAFNLASIKTDGFDIEMGYRQRMLGGTLSLRALATHVSHFITDPGIPGTIAVDTAGANSGNTPHWKLLGTESFETDKFTFNLQQRWFSDGVYANTYVVCSAGTCPTGRSATDNANYPTIDNNTMKGAFYLDVGGSYKLTPKFTAYFKIDNVFDKAPEPSPQTNTGVDVNAALYDLLGRFFRVGVRYNF